MTTPDKMKRALNEVEALVLTYADNMEYDAFRLLLSERAELLAAVERMRGALESAAETHYHVDDALMGVAEAGAVPAVGTWRFVTQEAKRARAALATGEEK